MRARPRNSLFVGAILLASNASTAAIAAPRATDDAAPADNADEVVVRGERVVGQASSGTKSDTPIVETPQSISVVSSADISQLGLANLNQALRYVAGVTPESRGANAEIYDQFKLRGFDAPRYLDGLRVFDSPTGYANPQVDVSRIDRIEVVKGPASVLYGQSSPGGLVAISSKLPLDQQFYGAVSGTYGTYNLYNVDADIGGWIDRNVLWRLYGAVNGADTQQSFGKRRRATVSGAVTIGAGSDTSLTVLAAYSHDPQNGNYGSAPALGTLFANPNGKIATQFADGEPGDFFRREQAALTYIFTHRFSEDWAFRSSGRYQYASTDLGAIYQTGVATDATLTTFGRAAYATDEKLNNWTFDNQLSGRFRTGPLTHQVMIGVDRQVAHSTEIAAFGDTVNGIAVTPINAFHPGYGTTPVPLTPGAIGTPGSYDAKLRQTGLYAQDQISWGGLRVTLSGRHDWAETENGASQRDRKFTWRAGALYMTPIGVAPYVSYSTSFQPQLGQVLRGDGTTTGASPSLGRQIEAGVKYQPPGTAILLTAAWFRIEQTNLLTAVPNSIYSTQSGKVRSQGVEAEATVPLPHGFTARAAFSHQIVKTVADADPANIGKGLIGVGRGNAAFNLDWAPEAGSLAGLKLGGGLRWVDKVYAGSDSHTPSYTLFDALLRYDLGRANPSLKGLEIGLNATNIFDRKYLTSCYLSSVGWCWYGQRRTVQGTIGFRW
ncbi:TonB-dependent siderophore receptor [Sphingomonas lycopersici]|uniref:TonB-dependent siderophore receptor n=1 Tax=Sphingomonas lycopersici TaxID=2951807 RepID=A0AA41ZCG5_9SPHN|nr:TonB-dependent siderophore receptor [Sphingomonas lycopersici]MCW6534101.1 TonB-dependent siderophore receptor [Sphingomonas lycopersici]